MFDKSKSNNRTNDEATITKRDSNFLGSTNRYKQRSLPTEDFLEAIKKDNLSLIQEMHLKFGARLLDLFNQQCGLIIAVCENAHTVMGFFLSEGADVDKQDSLGGTALHHAANTNNLQAIIQLLESGANPSCKNRAGHTPIDLANSMGHENSAALIRQVSSNNHAAAKLNLHQNIIDMLTDGRDFISEASYAIALHLEKPGCEYRESLVKIHQQLLQPEDLLIDEKSSSIKTLAQGGRKSEAKTEAQLKESPFFRIINELIASLNRFSKAHGESTSPSLVNISKLLINARVFYEQFQNRICASIKTPESYKKFKLDLRNSRKGISNAICANNNHIRGALGVYYINADTMTQFFSVKKNEHGYHKVSDKGPIFVKQNPDAPPVEEAFYRLGNLFGKQISAVTELMIFENNETSFPVICSKRIIGINFLEILNKHPTWLKKINSRSFSAQAILALLTNTGDGKPDNFIIPIEENKKEDEIGTLEIIGIDNDIAFGKTYIAHEPPVKTEEDIKKNLPDPPTRRFLDLKSIFLCMDQMDDVIDQGFQKTFREQSAPLIILEWLKALLLEEDRYLKYCKMPGKEAVLKKSRIPLTLLPGTIQDIYNRICRIQHLMKSQKKLTHTMLFDDLYPTLSACYQLIRTHIPNELDRYEKIAHFSDLQASEDELRRPTLTREKEVTVSVRNLSENGGYEITEEKVTLPALIRTKRMEEELNGYTLTKKNINNGKKETLIESAQKFINNFNYSTVDIHIQSQILDIIGADFPQLESLVFNNSKALTDKHLSTLSKRIKSIKSLKLINCSTLDGSGLSTILQDHQEVQIYLEGFESITAENLLPLLKRKNLTVKIGNNEYTIQDKEQIAELFKQAIQSDNYSSLIAAMLLSGAHLGFNHGAESPLHIALQQGKEKAVLELIRYGAPLNHCNKEGQSPLDLAVQGYNLHTNPEQQALYHSIIVNLVSSGARDTSHGATILKLLDSCKEFLPKAAKHIFTFAYSHHLLTAHWVTKLISGNRSELDLSSPKDSLAKVRLTTEIIDALAKKLPSLKKLNIVGCEGLTKEVFIKIVNEWKPTILAMDYDQAAKCGVVQLNNLKDFAIWNTGSVSVRITHLSLNGVPKKEAPKRSTGELKNSKQEKQRLTQEELFSLIKFIADNPYLEELELTNCNLSFGVAKDLAPSFAKNKSLKLINLNHNPLEDDAVAILLQALKEKENEQRCLETLLLEDTRAGRKSAILLGKMLENHRSLAVLSLQGNFLGDEGVQELAQGLILRNKEDDDRKRDGLVKKGNDLKRLTLNQVNMNTNSALLLSQALASSTKLEFLDFGFNNLEEECATYFIELLQSNGRLKEFKYDGNKLTGPLKKKFEHQLYINKKLREEYELESINSENKSLQNQSITSLLSPESTELNHVQQENETLRQEKIEVELKNQTLEQENKELKQENETLEQRNEELEQKILRLEQEAARLKQPLLQAQQTNENGNRLIPINRNNVGNNQFMQISREYSTNSPTQRNITGNKQLTQLPSSSAQRVYNTNPPVQKNTTGNNQLTQLPSSPAQRVNNTNLPVQNNTIGNRQLTHSSSSPESTTDKLQFNGFK